MTNNKVLLIGAFGAMGRECQKFMLSDTKWSTVDHIFVGRDDPIKMGPEDGSFTIINCSNSFGIDLEKTLSSFMGLSRDVTLLHISSEAVANGTEYGRIKLRDEAYISQQFKNNSILRLGVPCCHENDTIIGLGYWDTIKLSSSSPLVFSFCGVSLHNTMDAFDHLLNDAPLKTIGTYIRLPFGRFVRRFIPFRRLNALLSRLNIVIIG